MLSLNKLKIFLLLIVCLSALLRLFDLSGNPPSLYSDEINQGYNAYSLMTSGMDEHGAFWPVSLRSFGDWKPPLPTIMMIPFIAVFGLNEIAVRLPSALTGALSVLLVFYFVRMIFAPFGSGPKIALIAAFFMGISPWAVMQSRAAMLVSVSLFFILWGLNLVYAKSGSLKYYSGIILLTLSVYTYYGSRLVIPLLMLTVFLQKGIFKNLKVLLISATLVIVILFPLAAGFIDNPDVVFGRAKTVSVFYDRGPGLRLWELISQDGIDKPPLLLRFMHNRPHIYGKQIIKNFFSHFEGEYLFLKGDGSQPFTIPGMGILYLADGLLIAVGLYFLVNRKYPNIGFLLVLLLVSVLPSALTFMVPAQNRTFNAVVPLMIASSAGLYFISRKFGKNMLIPSVFSAVYILQMAYFMNMYFIKLPREYSHYWNYGWRETVAEVAKMESGYNNIIVSGRDGMPYIYFLFYRKVDPALFQRSALRTSSGDRFGYEHVEEFGKYVFPKDLDWSASKEKPRNRSIYVIPAAELPPGETSGKSVNFPDGKPAIRIFTYE